MISSGKILENDGNHSLSNFNFQHFDSKQLGGRKEPKSW